MSFTSVVIALPKSPGATECELHNTVSVASHFTKHLLRLQNANQNANYSIACSY